MHGQELLAALALRSPGIDMHMSWQDGKSVAIVTTLYQPTIQAVGSTLFDAAFEVSRQLLTVPNAPPDVIEALEHMEHPCLWPA